MYPSISICIPTFNGQDTLYNTINSIIVQNSNQIEVLISDDDSIDDTYCIARELANKSEYIRLFKNEKNLGMDKNFELLVQKARGEFIWFCGQDDIYLKGSIALVIAEIKKYPDAQNILLNFSIYDHDMENMLVKNGLSLKSFPDKLIEKKRIIIDSPNEYFSLLSQPPTFLPTIIMKKSIWEDSRKKEFYNTHYIQTGLILLNMHKSILIILPKILIHGRLPNDQWQNDGNKLFNINLGYLKTVKIASNLNDHLPRKVLLRNQYRYLLNYIFAISKSRNMGLNYIADNAKADLKYIFGPILFNLYLHPLSYMPKTLLDIIVSIGRLFKFVLFKISTINRLRY